MLKPGGRSRAGSLSSPGPVSQPLQSPMSSNIVKTNIIPNIANRHPDVYSQIFRHPCPHTQIFKYSNIQVLKYPGTPHTQIFKY